jgi:hypothetical protein
MMMLRPVTWCTGTGFLIALLMLFEAGFPNPTGAAVTASHSILVGPGFTDVSPHQLVRTSGDVLYVVLPTCDSYPSCPSNTLRVYRANQTGVPSGFTEQDSAHRPSGIGSSAVAIDGADLVHVAWNDRGGSLNYRTFHTTTGLWGTTTVLGPTGWTTFGQGDEGVALALDASGVPHVAYTRMVSNVRRVSYTNRIGGAWSTPAQVDDAPIGNNQGAWHPTLAFYPNGNLLLAWYVGSFNYTPDGTIYFRTRSQSSGTWGTRTTISGDTLMSTIDNGPSLLITPDGTAHVTFLNAGTASGGGSANGDFVHAYYNSESGWVANHPGGGTQITHNPSLGPGPNGTVRIYGHGWQGGSIDGHGDDLYYFEGGTSGWGPWTIYASGEFDSSVSTRWAQFFHVFPGTLDIAYWQNDYPNTAYVGTDIAGGDPPTPTSIPTSTPVPTATSVGGSCSDRPRVGLTTARLSSGQLRATVSAQTSSTRLTNGLTSIRITRIRNASVQVNGSTVGEGSSVTFSAGTQQATLLVTRRAPAQNPSLASTVDFVAADGCGDWPTLVGGGPGAF